MKIIAQINTLNSAEYLWYVLKSIYEHVDRIVIIDGAFSPKIKPSQSDDDTLNIVKNYEDYAKKIIFVQNKGFSQTEQRNIIFKYTEGFDWLFLVDDDEVYKDIDLLRMRKFLENETTSFQITGYNFVNDFYHYYETQNMRLWPIYDGMYYAGPNTIKHKNEKICKLLTNKTTVPGIIRYHYSYVRSIERVRLKIRQVESYQNIKKFPWQVNGEFVKRDNITFKKFDGNHPILMHDHPYKDIKWVN